MNKKIRTIIIVILANVLLIGIKFVLATISGSMALRASAWHSLSDLFPSIVVIASLIVNSAIGTASKKRSGRIDNITAVIVSLFIFYVGIELITESFSGETHAIENIAISIIISVVSIAITYFMAKYQIMTGRETDSPALTANGIHARADMYSSIAVLVALIGAMMGFSTLDKIISIVISIMILVNGIEVLTSAVSGLIKGDSLLAGDHEHHDSFRIFKKFYRFAPLVILICIAGYFASGIFTVSYDEKAVIKRFGKPVRQVNPGIQYRLPWPFESYDTISVSTIRNEKIETSLMLTGDSNLIEIEAVIHYQINDPFRFLYNLSEPDLLIRDIAKSSIQELINKNVVDFILSDGKDFIQKEALQNTQRLLDRQETGITIMALQLIKDTPPPDVMEAFRDVASAREDKSTYINEALSYQSELLPKTRGEAQKSLEEATAYRDQKINTASGDAGRFSARATAYRADPGITERRLYIESLEKSLASINKIIVDRRVNIETTDIWLQNGANLSNIIKEN